MSLAETMSEVHAQASSLAGMKESLLRAERGSLEVAHALQTSSTRYISGGGCLHERASASGHKKDAESAALHYSLGEKRFLELSTSEQRQEMATMEALKTQVEQLAA